MPATLSRIAAVVIGAGQAGLAASRVLTDLGVDHVVLERGRVADRWRTQGWDSLHLLTPRWMSRLPRWRWTGPDPAGYMSRRELVDHLSRYATSFASPVLEHTEVLAVDRRDDGFVVRSTNGTWAADAVLVATGHCALPRVPAWVTGLDPRVHHLHSDRYRRPDALPEGGVLVVGASASGTQIADELRSAGRDVLLAVGRHTRLPRRYRGRDILSWLSQTGSLDRPRTSLPDPGTVPREASMQLVGRPDHRDVDLHALQGRGVELTGRVLGVHGSRVRLAPDLAATTTSADDRLRRVLRRVDHLADELGAPPPPGPFAAARTDGVPTELDLRHRGVSTVVWATGYRRSYPWLPAVALDPGGELRHDRGVSPVDGLYVLGQPWQTRRSSALLDGVGLDAHLVGHHVAHRVRACSCPDRRASSLVTVRS